MKPPIGLRPERIALLERYHEILDAIDRYQDASQEIPEEWLEEFDEILIKLLKRYTRC